MIIFGFSLGGLVNCSASLRRNLRLLFRHDKRFDHFLLVQPLIYSSLYFRLDIENDDFSLPHGFFSNQFIFRKRHKPLYRRIALQKCHLFAKAP